MFPTAPLPTAAHSRPPAVNVAKVLAKDGRLVPGAGATEMELAHRIAGLAAGTPGLAQYAIGKFAEALEAVPRALAESSGLHADDVVVSLYAAHKAGKTGAGVDVSGDGSGRSGVLADAVAAGVVDSAAVKLSALRLASDVAVTILRVDTLVMAKAAGGPKPRAAGPQDADD